MEQAKRPALFTFPAEDLPAHGALIEALRARACSYAKACLRSSPDPRCA